MTDYKKLCVDFLAARESATNWRELSEAATTLAFAVSAAQPGARTSHRLSPRAREVFEAFNRTFEWVEDGVPGPQFKALAAALRAAVCELRKEEYETPGGSYAEMIDVDDLLDLARELESCNLPSLPT